jgi:hypothetical protein
MCAVDPNMAGLVVPLAQAAVITAPILLRKQIGRAVRTARGRREPESAEALRCPPLTEPKWRNGRRGGLKHR